MSQAVTVQPIVRNTQLLLPMGVVALVAIMVVPVPAVFLDILISLNIALSMLVLLTSLYIRSPIQFSVYPSTLLLLTLFRLGLNVSTTRRILLHGPEGTHAAGNVIEAFGQFVVGGNMVVGLVMFLILLAIQFVVINHGATRISEVAARFTLDAMPGKQMSIDADLNAGLIDESEARERREAIQNEADFYGSMDGAVRFTQRDAIASLIIVAINIIAGLAIGTMQAGMAVGDAARTFTTLTVGDGLVSAIPALIVSVSGGLITTRKTTRNELGGEVASQLLTNPKPLLVGGSAMVVLALIPGLPTLSFLILGGILGGLGFAARRSETQEITGEEYDEELALGPPPEESVEPLLTVDPLTIEVGYDLVEMAGSDQSGGLLDRIRGIRRQVALDLGLVVPPVRVRDNLRIGADEYQILMRGAEIGSARLPRHRVLAIDPGNAIEPLEGEPTTDPAFGIDALWIPENMADHARAMGYTVVDRTSVMATHLSEIIRRHAPELLSRQDTQRLLDTLSKSAPKLAEELVPERFTLGQVQKVLQSLLRERVSIRDLQTIGETMADYGPVEDLQVLVGAVRQSMGRSLVKPLTTEGVLPVITVTADVEQEIRNLLTPAPDGSLMPPDPRITQSLAHRVANAVQNVPPGTQPIVLCGSNDSRTVLRRLTDQSIPTVPFISVTEVPDDIRVRSVGQVQ
jgi:flagellar biosynthesis protein FlhA